MTDQDSVEGAGTGQGWREEGDLKRALAAMAAHNMKSDAAFGHSDVWIRYCLGENLG